MSSSPPKATAKSLPSQMDLAFPSSSAPTSESLAFSPSFSTSRNTRMPSAVDWFTSYLLSMPGGSLSGSPSPHVEHEPPSQPLIWLPPARS